jgi:iron-sulfur cluster assembly accessory protein
VVLEHDPEKWKPVFGKDHAPTKYLVAIRQDSPRKIAISAPEIGMTGNVTVTDRAALRIGEILKGEPNGTMLRVSVAGGGCSGFQYRFDTERARADDDIVIEKSGATVLIDPVSLNYMAGAEIDFVDDLIGSSFKINNPQATASCGCGTSFSL